MQLPLYKIDAFTDRLFGGNPACVVPLQEWLEDALLQQIARENAVPETAFFIPDGNRFALRWFTPDLEMDLCGHATLATAHALKTILHHPEETIVFTSRSGPLEVSVHNGLYTLNFPSRNPVPAPLPDIIRQALDRQPRAVLKARDYVLVYDSEADVRDIQINRSIFDQINLDPGGMIITAKGEHCDFVSRFFTPQTVMFEDPVTGSAHCSLIPYWAAQLGKKEMEAVQLSERTGRLHCVDNGDRVLIAGQARTYAIGTLWTE
ncbi:PhzF family phenazine biosynthesis protein [Chitinophaga japonensis]|uniref:PhzF family phenazine biosynthesis protein n=1 Tax=Chitinophaga japonensis TaxID=104662 RepID=A0A562TFE1_CHIJA|nr:PhzF family phenazine biosynthesis protein [Chitinophaga japonensis]TWI92083.1 PhzF family phenazine biosynthesis protein [Chitinophaga japonensis]